MSVNLIWLLALFPSGQEILGVYKGFYKGLNSFEYILLCISSKFSTVQTLWTPIPQPCVQATLVERDSFYPRLKLPSIHCCWRMGKWPNRNWDKCAGKAFGKMFFLDKIETLSFLLPSLESMMFGAIAIMGPWGKAKWITEKLNCVPSIYKF